MRAALGERPVEGSTEQAALVGLLKSAKNN